MCEAPLALRGRMLREGHWRCESPTDEGCKQRGSSTFSDEAFLFLHESNCFQCSILISYLKKIKPLA
jgi:hypothetical protein